MKEFPFANMPNELLPSPQVPATQQQFPEAEIYSDKAPTHPHCPFACFAKHYPRNGIRGSQRVQEVRQAWDALSEEEKQPFVAEAQADAERYQRQVADYEREGRYYNAQGEIAHPARRDGGRGRLQRRRRARAT